MRDLTLISIGHYLPFGRFLNQLESHWKRNGSQNYLSRLAQDTPETSEKDLQQALRRRSELRDALYETNKALVLSRAQKANVRGVELSDLFQEGSLGLIIGIEAYDPSYRTQPSTYVIWWIIKKINNYVDKKADLIPISPYFLNKARQIDKAYNDYLHTVGWPPSIEELAERVELEPKEIEKLLRMKQLRRSVSLLDD